MRVDFYHLSRVSAEAALPLIARRAMGLGERMLIVSGDAQQRQRISRALWTAGEESFLANGSVGEGGDERQPILLSAETVAVNGARYLAIADGQWRDAATPFERTFFLFDETTIAHARATWRALRARDDAERHYWKQDGGTWVEAG